MSLPDFDVRLTRIAELAQKKEYSASLELTLETKELLFSLPSPDPVQIGWILHFEFANLYALKNYDKAWAAFQARVPFPYGMTRQNQAWRLSVASELASHMNDPLEVLRLARRALAMRMFDEDFESRVQVLVNACVFLRKIEREDLNLEFTRYLLSSGAAHHVTWMIIEGLRHICWNAEKTANRTVHQILEHYLELVGNDKKLCNEPGVEKILERGFDLMLRHRQILEHRRSRKDETAQLLNAIENQDVEAAEQMLRSGGDPDGIEPEKDSEPVFPPLHRSVQLGSFDLCRLLVSYGADIHDQERSGGFSPLALAVNSNNLALTGFFLAHGADPNKKTDSGQTLLMRMVIENNFQMTAFLIDQGAFTESRDDMDNTALQLAATESSPQTLQILIDAGADALVTNDQGHGLMHLAAMHGHVDNLETLAEYGLPPNLADKVGLKPIDWARKGNHQAATDFLAELDP